MNRKFIPVLDQLLPGALLLALGIAIFCWKSGFVQIVFFLMALLSFVSAIGMLIMLLLRRKELGGKRITLSGALISVAIGGVLMFTPSIPLTIFGYLFSLYILINGAAKLVNFILFTQNKVKGRWKDSFDALFFLTFGILLLFTPLFSVDSIMVIIGVYGILLGSFNMIEFFRPLLPKRTKRFIRRNIRISLPVWLVMLIPHYMLRRVNSYLKENSDELTHNQVLSQYKSDIDPSVVPDAEVFIHVTQRGTGAMGHCDFCIDNTVISYGNYDESSRRVFEGAGNGVLFYAPRDKYIEFVTRYNQKTLFVFGLKLSAEQKTALARRLQELKKPLYEWMPIYERDLLAGNAKPPEHYPDYASQLYRYTGAEFRKFKYGKFKSYFVLSTNCVQLVDYVLSAAGTDIIKINGIVTPGTYYDYLFDEFRKPGTMVISRTIYTEDPDNALKIPRETEIRENYAKMHPNANKKKRFRLRKKEESKKL